MDVFGALSFPQLTDKDVLIWLGVFFGVLLVFDGLRQVSRRSGGEASARNRRMRMMSKGADQEQILAALTRNDVRGNETIGTAGRLRRMLRRADLSVALSTVVIGSVALGALAAVGLSQLAGLPAAAIGVLGALLLPVMVIAQMGNARMEKLVRQLPDALDMMSRGLKVGHPVAVTLRRVASEMPDPIGTEFGIMEDRVRHGAEISQSFREFAERVDLEDARYLAASIAIQHGTGGNLARILTVLSGVIRGRLNMRKRIRALSSEGRLSGLILSVMPFLIVGTIAGSTPSFYGDVMDHPVFLPVAALCGTLLALQALILHRLTSFDF